jgi:hypothetical protein
MTEHPNWTQMMSVKPLAMLQPRAYTEYFNVNVWNTKSTETRILFVLFGSPVCRLKL